MQQVEKTKWDGWLPLSVLIITLIYIDFVWFQNNRGHVNICSYISYSIYSKFRYGYNWIILWFILSSLINVWKPNYSGEYKRHNLDPQLAFKIDFFRRNINRWKFTRDKQGSARDNFHQISIQCFCNFCIRTSLHDLTTILCTHFILKTLLKTVKRNYICTYHPNSCCKA